MSVTSTLLFSLIVTAGLIGSASPAASEPAPIASTSPLDLSNPMLPPEPGCAGCGSPGAFSNTGGIVTFADEPDLLSGSCTGVAAPCTPNPCLISGTLSITCATGLSFLYQVEINGTSGPSVQWDSVDGPLDFLWAPGDKLECGHTWRVQLKPLSGGGTASWSTTCNGCAWINH